MAEIWKPKPITRREILDTIGESKDFRNPVRMPDFEEGYLKKDVRAKAYEKLMGTQVGSFAVKGKP